MYEFTVFKKPNNSDAQWQLRYKGKLVAAALVDQAYTAEIEGEKLKFMVSSRKWATISPGHEISPALQPKDVLQPGKDTVLLQDIVQDQAENSAGWLKTVFQLKDKTQV